jgi:hypothetical protein
VSVPNLQKAKMELCCLKTEQMKPDHTNNRISFLIFFFIRWCCVAVYNRYINPNQAFGNIKMEPKTGAKTEAKTGAKQWQKAGAKQRQNRGEKRGKN